MDFSKYDQSFQDLHQQHQNYLKVADKRIISVLNRMLKQAQMMNDTELIGYIYHSMAFAEHFIMGRYQRFLYNLRMSYNYLLRCSDQSEMMHIYYLIAVDATNKGLNDMAVLYFHEARNIAEDAGLETSVAILDISIGHIFMQLGQYGKARKYIKESLQGIKKDKAHPHHLSNLMANYMNDAIACIELNNIRKARQSFEKVRDLMEKHPNELRSGTHIHYELLRLRLALSDGNDIDAKSSFKELLSLMRSDTMLHLYMSEIKKLSRQLLDAGKHQWLLQIIQIIDENGIAPDAIDALKDLLSIKNDYYKAAGNTEKLIESYATQEEVRESIRNQEKALRRYIEGLVQFTTDLRKERERILALQEKLVNMTETDQLTKLSNRYSASIRLSELFDNAYNNKTKLGVVYIDLDGLKEINDSQGHLEGDRYLVSLAEALKRQSEKKGFFASRFGGDEFVLIFENKSDEEIEDCISSIKAETKARFSAGFYNAVPLVKQKSWDFLEYADIELYKEKKKKKYDKNQGIEKTQSQKTG